MRIATGRNAADTAWVSVLGVQVNFVSLEVNADADDAFDDDHSSLVNLPA